MIETLVGPNDRVLVTGAAGFIGRRVVTNLLERGFTNIVCLFRPTPAPVVVEKLFGPKATGRIEIHRGNLLSRNDCLKIVPGVKAVIHLAAGMGEKSYADAYLNSVVTTRNLLEACITEKSLARFVNISSFAVYSNDRNPHGSLLDESAPMDPEPVKRGQAYCFAKVRQDEMVMDYGRKHGLPYVIVRPGVVYGPGNEAIHSRVGLGTFGIFLHCGGGNQLPLTYVENTAEAIVLAAITRGIDGEIFNAVDNDLPSCRFFLRQYKRQVRNFTSLWVPRPLSYLACYLWEKYVAWSDGQLPNAFNRSVWRANWKWTKYSNAKLKSRVGWNQKIPTGAAMKTYFDACRGKEQNA
jgi:nucleoside-diphosphate-sugar epimerase